MGQILILREDQARQPRVVREPGSIDAFLGVPVQHTTGARIVRVHTEDVAMSIARRHYATREAVEAIGHAYTISTERYAPWT